MAKWPFWIGTVLLAVAGLQLAMIFVLPGLPLGASSESAQASNGDASAGGTPAAPDMNADPQADLPLYTACVRETPTHPMQFAAGTAHTAPGDRHGETRRIDILFVFSGNARSANAPAGGSEVVMQAPAQFGVVMMRRVVAHGREAGMDGDARQSADCTPF
ncbi:hypothetical protein [Parvibaculum sp.]|uniref:hypothetical protein n=1 Tax=Parvibaculum sp. TaxID=2024848 RepID=UPI000C892853|nr:hypothetical protein [Parvibaculum sp.]MAB13335.1 hypothetical protein [Parvibaculum sp.]